jgi:hypothetical protein
VEGRLPLSEGLPAGCSFWRRRSVEEARRFADLRVVGSVIIIFGRIVVKVATIL